MDPFAVEVGTPGGLKPVTNQVTTGSDGARPRSPEVSDDQGHDLRERDRGLCGNLLNHRTLYR